MGYPHSARFQETIAGSHVALVRLTLLSKVVVGADPRTTAGPGYWWDLPLHDSGSADVTLDSTSDVKGSLQLTVPGEWWDQVAPFGAEVHAERGVSFGDGTSELVPLGYYRIEDVDQDDAPYGPVTLDLVDRTGVLAGVEAALPWQIPTGTSHRAIFDRLTAGSADGVGGYGMYGAPYVAHPVDWTGAGYDPDTTVTTKAAVVEDGVGEFLASMVAEQGAVIVALATGELAVVARERAEGATPDITLREGATGTLVKASRRISRAGVFNYVRTTGSDPAAVTGYRFAYLTDPSSPIRFNGPFGPVGRRYASPLLKDSEAADAAAETILARSTGLPTELSAWTVPNPTIRPLDAVEVVLPTGVSVHVVDRVTIPLSGSSPVQVSTRTLNTVPQNPTDPEPDTQPQPDPDPAPGGDPSDGTQAAVVRGWGSIIAGDEFAGTTADLPAKWGLYNGAGHGGNGLRRPSAFSVVDGMMRIHGSANDVSGGAAFRHRSPGRGYRVELRARVYNTDNSGGDRYHPVLILWPDGDDWPAGAEYDFFETDEGDGKFGLFMHLPNHSPYRQDHYSETLDIQNWHNYACEWDAGGKALRAFVDGRMVYEGKGRVAEAPYPMHLTVQLDHFGGNPRAANFDIAWVRVYTRPGA